jgi:hypothetical protein
MLGGGTMFLIWWTILFNRASPLSVHKDQTPTLTRNTPTTNQFNLTIPVITIHDMASQVEIRGQETVGQVRISIVPGDIPLTL